MKDHQGTDQSGLPSSRPWRLGRIGAEHEARRITAQDVRRFVATRWEGQYVTYRDHAHAGYPECWVTRLHGPTGPVVITGVTADGVLVDLTR